MTLFGFVGILQVLQYLSFALAKHSLQVSHRKPMPLCLPFDTKAVVLQYPSFARAEHSIRVSHRGNCALLLTIDNETVFTVSESCTGKIQYQSLILAVLCLLTVGVVRIFYTLSCSDCFDCHDTPVFAPGVTQDDFDYLTLPYSFWDFFHANYYITIYHANTGRLGLNDYVCSKPIPGFAVFVCLGKEIRAVHPPKKEGVLSVKII